MNDLVTLLLGDTGDAPVLGVGVECCTDLLYDEGDAPRLTVTWGYQYIAVESRRFTKGYDWSLTSVYDMN